MSDAEQKAENVAILVVRPKSALIFEARRVLGLNRDQLGALLESSKRTVARWEGGQSTIHAEGLFELARKVHPRDAALAKELSPRGRRDAREARRRVSSRRAACRAPDTGACPRRRHRVRRGGRVEGGAETVRASVLAAFRRARELRMTVEDVEVRLPSAGERR